MTARRKTSRKRSNSRPKSRRARLASLVAMTDDELLDLRLCDLCRFGVALEKTEIMDRVERMYEELEERDIRFLPHVWLSSEWFSPDGVPGIGIPFYLAHERLARLEKKMMHEAEGAPERQCMKILRHEAGHAICTAYRLHYRKKWRETFGLFSEPYPEIYHPKPSSREYVQHFDWWYAQAHPAEDFAETFAVWLRPRAQWRRQYHGWPVMRKLECVDELMADIAGAPPAVSSREKVEPLRSLRSTLRRHYQRKRRRYGSEWPDFFDGDLRKIFSDAPKYRRRETAASFLRRARPAIREAASMWTSEHPYTIDQVLRDMIDRCKELNLRLACPESEARMHAMLMVTVQTMNYIHGGGLRFAL